MLTYLSNLFDTSNNETREKARNELRIAKNCFERAMRTHGVNSEQANHWAAKADEAEKALGL
ncbi:hypothetical protein D3C85_223840 [compost metagenome]